MTERATDLQRLLDATEASILAGTAFLPSARPVAETIFAALEVPPGTPGPSPKGARPPVCAHLEPALANARAGPPHLAALADALAAVSPRLAFAPRPGSEDVAGSFRDHHANAVIVGEGGLEQRADVRVGVSLMAPHTTYPDHRHPPEEVYVVLSAGAWRQDRRPWVWRQPGELVHNPPGIWHAMQSRDAPLLAIWCLWMR